jgi:hypothetical protein
MATKNSKNEDSGQPGMTFDAALMFTDVCTVFALMQFWDWLNHVTWVEYQISFYHWPIRNFCCAWQRYFGGGATLFIFRR